MKVLLKIGNSWRELTTDQQTSIELTTTHDNGENPSQMVDEYSYNLQAPRCKDNDLIFGRFYRLDSIRIVGEYDPTEKIETRILADDGSLLLAGFCVVATIDANYYNLSVTGSRSVILDKLINSGYDTTNTDEGYTLLTDPFSTFLNRRLVAASFSVAPSNVPFYLGQIIGQGAALATRYGIDDAAMAEFVSICGFAPTTQGEPRGIDGGQWLTQLTDENGKKIYGLNFAPVLTRNADGTGYSGDNPLTEATMSQYRSWTQQPYIYINKLWQLVQDNCPQLTGYTMQLDNRWFNAGNRLLCDVVYTLPQLVSEETKEVEQLRVVKENAGTNTGAKISKTAEVTLTTAVRPVVFNLATPNPSTEDNIMRGSVTIDLNTGATPTSVAHSGNTYLRSDKFALGLDATINGTTIVKYCYVVLADDDPTSEQLALYKAMASSEWPKLEQQGYIPKVARQKTSPHTGGHITIDLSFIYHANGLHNLSVTAGLIQTTISPFCVGLTMGDYTNTIHTGVRTLYQSATMVLTSEEHQRSNSRITLGRVLGHIKPITPLLQYSKLMRLSWVVDEDTKTIRVIRTRDWLNDCSHNVQDITDYIDQDGQTITPLSWTAHNVLLNYAPNNLTDYETRHGMPYGSKKIVTTNKTNKATEELLCTGEYDTIQSPIIATEVAYNRVAYTGNNLSARPITNKPMLLNVKDGKSADYHGAFYIRRGNQDWPLGLAMVEYNNGAISAYIGITDDTTEEDEAQVYCWHDLAQKAINGKIYPLRLAGTMPIIDICDDAEAVAVQMAQAKESYTMHTYSPNLVYLYDTEWSRYIDEVYNPNNKTITTGARLPRKVWQQLRGNPLVVYGRQLFYVLKIEGWSERTTFCKLTMRKVSDLQNLIN